MIANDDGSDGQAPERRIRGSSGLQLRRILAAAAVFAVGVIGALGTAAFDRARAQMPTATPGATETATPDPTGPVTPTSTLTTTLATTPTTTPTADESPTPAITPTSEGSPTPSPTATPTPIRNYLPVIRRDPTPTATPTPWFLCHVALVNGDFEQLSASWLQVSPSGQPLVRADRPHFGAAGAWLGGYDFADDQLINATAIGLFRADGGLSGDLVSATLKWKVWMDSTENGEGRDALGLLFVNNRSASEVVSIDSVTTERAQRNVWIEGSADVTAAVTRRSRWSQAELRLVALTGAHRPTGWAVDDVHLEVCLRR